MSATRAPVHGPQLGQRRWDVWDVWGVGRRVRVSLRDLAHAARDRALQRARTNEHRDAPLDYRHIVSRWGGGGGEPIDVMPVTDNLDTWQQQNEYAEMKLRELSERQEAVEWASGAAGAVPPDVPGALPLLAALLVALLLLVRLAEKCFTASLTNRRRCVTGEWPASNVTATSLAVRMGEYPPPPPPYSAACPPGSQPKPPSPPPPPPPPPYSKQPSPRHQPPPASREHSLDTGQSLMQECELPPRVSRAMRIANDRRLGLPIERPPTPRPCSGSQSHLFV